MEDEQTRAELLAKIQELETEQVYAHRTNGYQLNRDDISALDRLIQRALREGSPDALAQFSAIRTAHEVHGKVSYEQLKLLKEVSDVFDSYGL